MWVPIHPECTAQESGEKLRAGEKMKSPETPSEIPTPWFLDPLSLRCSPLDRVPMGRLFAAANDPCAQLIQAPNVT